MFGLNCSLHMPGKHLLFPPHSFNSNPGNHPLIHQLAATTPSKCSTITDCRFPSRWLSPFLFYLREISAPLITGRGGTSPFSSSLSLAHMCSSPSYISALTLYFSSSSLFLSSSCKHNPPATISLFLCFPLQSLSANSSISRQHLLLFPNSFQSYLSPYFSSHSSDYSLPSVTNILSVLVHINTTAPPPSLINKSFHSPFQSICNYTKSSQPSSPSPHHNSSAI